MKCSKCHVNLSDVDKYCPRCGAIFDNNDVKELGDTLENQLLGYYLEKEYFNSKISLGYLLFNFAYLFYKKMYKDGLISMISLFIFLKLMKIKVLKNLIISSQGFYFLPIMFILIVCVIVICLYLFKSQELHINYSKQRVQRIISSTGSKDIKLLHKLCKNDSKNNIIVAILSIIGFLIIFFL